MQIPKPDMMLSILRSLRQVGVPIRRWLVFGVASGVLAACGGGGGGSSAPAATAPAPRVLSLQVGGLIDVPTDLPLSVVFSDEIAQGTLTSTSVTLTSNDGVAVATRFAYANRQLTITPLTLLAPSTHYRVALAATITSTDGRAIAPASFTFDTSHFSVALALTTLSSTVNFGAVAVGDVNGDGLPDVVMSSGFPGGLNVFLQTPTGGLAAPVVYAFPDQNCDATTIAIGDMNGDGRLDVVTGGHNAFQCGLLIFTQTSSGTLALSLSIPSTDAYRVKLADFDADGKLDIVGASATMPSMTIWKQLSGGAIDAGTTYSLPTSGTVDLKVGDVTGDGRADVVVLTGPAVDKIGVWAQLPGGTLAAPVYYDIPPNTSGSSGASIAIGDLNHDGRQDVVLSLSGIRNGRVLEYLQVAGGTLVAQPTFMAYANPGPIVVGDLDGDGRDDIFVIHDGWGTVSIFYQGTDGNPLGEIIYDIGGAGSYYPHGVAIADINHDGLPDIVIADTNGLMTMRQSR